MTIKNLLATFAITIFAVFAGCKKDDFVEIIGKCPQVISTNPVNAAVGVSLNTVIKATFNEKMNSSTITGASFTVNGVIPVVGVITYSDSTASFTPTNVLLPNTTYTGRITTLVKDINGNALQTDYIWTFSTGIVLTPNVVFTDPENLASGVVLNKIVSATFSINIEPSTIDASSFYLKQGAMLIPGTLTVKDNKVSFKPSLPFTSNTTYTGTITTDVKNLHGTAIQGNYVWKFTTGALKAPMVSSTDPTDNALGVPQNKVITVTFDDQMNASTINTSSFRIYDGSNVVNGKVSLSGITASFTP